LVHDQVQGKVLDEKGRVVLESLAVQGVENGVARAISGSCAAVCLATLSVLEALATKGTLVDLASLCARERHTIVLKLKDRVRRLAAHVVDRILSGNGPFFRKLSSLVMVCIYLITEPVTALDRVVHVPSPVVLGHVAEGSVDTALLKRKKKKKKLYYANLADM